ncbi:O-antigen ligase family protein [Microvirga soli]|uniref:O-antigen ligase family protein n=1 Tax=Microvirga soli TaxID=1854496 RepID=UPI00191FA5CC|nr:O-antigen ligase family protein [Microvirga soli]
MVHSSQAQAAKAVLFLIAICSFANFNPLLTGLSPQSNLQQTIAVVLWLTIVLLSFTCEVHRRVWTDEMYFCAIFFWYVACSSLWNNNPSTGIPKAVALIISTWGAWRVSLLLDFRAIMQTVMHALGALIVASVAVVLVKPSLGISNSWQHNGQWQGIFEVKQVLGTTSAILVFLSTYACIERITFVRFFYLCISLLCVVASGSRGGAIIAFFSVICVILARNSTALARLISIIPILVFCIATVTIVFLAKTGYSYIPIFGYEVDFTERTLIWQHALGLSLDRPFFGYGLNGFWTIDEIYVSFLKQRGWVLDNFHSGYVAIFTELGIVGISFVGVITFLIARRLARMIGRQSSRSLDEAFTREICFGLIIVLFVLNLTETIFLRSTNFMHIMFDLALFQCFSTRNHVVKRTAIGGGYAVQS